MIIVNGKYQIKKDKYNWILSEAYIGVDRQGNDKTQYKASYHATIKQVCNAIIDRELSDCDSIQEVLSILSDAEDILVSKVEDKL